MDGPGGAIFSGASGKQNDPNMQKHIEHLKTAKGLIICIDCTEILVSSLQKRQALKDFYNDSIQFLLTHVYTIEMACTHISFVLTKADLYAEKSGHKEDALAFLTAQDSMRIVVDIIGLEVFKTLYAFLNEKVLFLFSFSSVYGFSKGSVLSNRSSMHVSDWSPCNVVESMAFLLSGEPEHELHEVYEYKKLESRIRGER